MFKEEAMKVKVEIIDDEEEESIVIKARKISQEIQDIQEFLSKKNRGSTNLTVYQGEEEFFLPIDAIVFFETDMDGVIVHTTTNEYLSKERLYILEEKLPDQFIRVSKSTIVNCVYVFSIQRNLSASSKVTFMNTHKEVYVSRLYYKSLKMKMTERSF